MSVSRKVLRRMKKVMWLSTIPVLTACSSQISRAVDLKFDTSTGTLYVSGNGAIDKSWKKYYDQNSVRRVVIENGIEKIGDRTFSDCESLQNITISDSVTEIGQAAFYDCGFRKITMNGVTKIGSNAFSGCAYLDEIVIPYVTEIGEGAFNNCGFKEITLPNSLTKIDENLFLYCKSLYKISLPINITSIGRCAFMGCKSLEKITLPGSLDVIGEWAFNDCEKLNAVKFDNDNYEKNITLERGVFEGCEKLRYFDTNGLKVKCGLQAFDGTPLEHLEGRVVCGKYRCECNHEMMRRMLSQLQGANEMFQHADYIPDDDGNIKNPTNCPRSY